MTAAFALTTSLLWGLADFGGGALSKRIRELTVVTVSQTAAMLVLGAIVLATGAWETATPRLLLCATAAGAIGPVAMFCFYRALALGPMGVVSPLATVGTVAVPMGVGMALHGERPGLIQIGGTVVAVVGIMLAGGAQLRGAPVQRQTVTLTLIAAVGFGATITFIAEAEASTTLTGLYLALFVQRAVNVLVGGGALYASARRGGSVLPEGGWRTVGAAMPALTFVGLADVAANGTYALAAQHGPVTVAAVLASLYPVVTALAARGVLRERMRATQLAGASLALAGTVLLASG